MGFTSENKLQKMAVLKEKETAIRELYPATLNPRGWDGPCNVYKMSSIRSLRYDERSNKIRIVIIRKKRTYQQFIFVPFTDHTHL